jgi:hypothetical protein
VFGLSQSQIYAVGIGGAFVQYDGTTWHVHPAAAQLPAGVDLYTVFSRAANDLYVGGQLKGTTAVAYHFDGTTLQPVAFPDTKSALVTGLYGDATALYGVAILPSVVLTNYGGSAGSLTLCQTIGNPPNAVTIGGPAVGIVVAAGYLRYYRFNSGCKPMTSSTGFSSNMVGAFNAVSATGADFYAVGSTTLIGHSATGVGTFEPTDGLPVADLYGVWAATADDVYAVGAGGTILHKH